MSRVIQFAAAGQAAIRTKISVLEDSELAAIVDMIRAADVAFVNLETPLFEPSAYPVKQYLHHSSYSTSPQFVAMELAWMGFHLISLANNHMSDFSPESIYTNQRLLAQAGLTYAGAGKTLTDARMPGYFDHPKGRTALIAVDSSWENGEFVQVPMASDPRGRIPGRPGVNGLRWYTTYVVDADTATRLKALARQLGREGHDGVEVALYRPLLGPDEFDLFGQHFRIGDPVGVETRCHPADLKEICAWVASAKAQSDFVLVSHHTHHAEGNDWERPADFTREFAHAAIDAGADAYIGHGYTCRGVEIHNGKPIIYELGMLAHQREAITEPPSDAFESWGLGAKATPLDLARAKAQAAYSEVPHDRAEAHRRWRRAVHYFVSSFTFEDCRLRDVRLRPIVLRGGTDLPGYRRGLPRFAAGAEAEAAFERLRLASAPFGTNFRIETGSAVVEL
jgi:poly-gamma-glutamate capsule biosynthesis protein CapA/YwtB (metallophosphatase superfamily)